MVTQHTPLVLIVLDGWGCNHGTEYNAIAAANTPVWSQLWRNFPHTEVVASGNAVGLPKGQMGNSEVGHLHMGAGRLVPQDLTRIDMAIESGEFFQSPVFNDTIAHLQQTQKALHVLGLLSPGGVHSHESHIQALIKLAANRGLKKVYVHAFLDGRDTPPKSAKHSLLALDAELKQLGIGKIASIVGRYYAMDRDKRWERTEQAYNLLTLGECNYRAETAEIGLEEAYARNETDEFVQATCIVTGTDKPITIQDGDAVIFMNFRSDRARQLTHVFIDQQFDHFKRKIWPKLSSFVTLTEYAADIPTKIAFLPISLTNIFGEYIAKQGYRQLRIAETEKYAHVTFFFNGGEEKSYPGEDRILIPSPKVTTYDLQPEMSAYELTRELQKAISSQKYQLIICNFANPDMVGHTGNFAATVKAIETVDICLGHIIESLYAVGGEAIITSDHGNAEYMFDPATDQPHTAHTNNLVPVIYIGRDAKPIDQQGVLYDIAPTMLYLLGLEQPKEMTGKTLFKFK